jgi:tol-pal system protein YbgF
VRIPGTVWIASICVLVFAGPAYPQSKEILQLQRDMINLQNQVKELQTSVDQNNQKLVSLVETLAKQLDQLNTSLPKIVDAVGGVRADNEKTATDLRALVGGLKESVDQLNQGMNGRDGVRAQLGSVSQQLKDMKSTAGTEPLATPEDLMRTAYADFAAGNYPLSIGGYKEFLSKYPNNPRAPEAQLKIADAYYNQGKYEPAITEYDIVLQKYPKDDKTGTALYKEGLAYKELGETDKATAALQRVQMEFPSSNEAALAKLKLMEWNPAPPPRGGTTSRGARGRGQ